MNVSITVLFSSRHTKLSTTSEGNSSATFETISKHRDMNMSNSEPLYENNE